MMLPLRIARRYLFARKSTNAINLITGIAVFGVCVGTAALVLILSVFNGFEDLITQMYSSFDPEVKVTPAKGKTFVVDSALVKRLHAIDGVAVLSQTLEEIAFFEYRNHQDFGILKGVDANWRAVTGIDSTVREGEFTFLRADQTTAVLGLGMRNNLAVDIGDLFAPLSVYTPKKREVGVLEEPFRKRLVYPAGTFVIQQEFDNKYVITSLGFARDLLGMPDRASALEIRLTPAAESRQRTVIDRIAAEMGEQFLVKDRYEQEATFLRLMQMEKWLSFAIVSLMMLLVSFNLVGALWMIVLEKKQDIATLKAMGATDATVRRIFLSHGVLLCLLGVTAGFLLALALYYIQITIGIVRIPGNFIVDAYPIGIRFLDFAVVFGTVVGIGLLASVPPALRAQRVPAFHREG